MVYRCTHGLTKYKFNKKIKNNVPYTIYGKKDFTRGIKCYELVGKTWIGISEKTSCKAFVKALICAMAADLSKEQVIENRDLYLSLCPSLHFHKEMEYVNKMIESATQDDIDTLIDSFDKCTKITSE